MKWSIIFIMGCGLIVISSDYADSSSAVSFIQAREIILSGNPGLKSARTETEAAIVGVDLSRTLPNPNAELSLDKFGVNELEARIEQTIELGGKRRLRTLSAQKDVDAALIVQKMTERELDVEIVRRFIPIATTEKKRAVVDSIIS